MNWMFLFTLNIKLLCTSWCLLCFQRSGGGGAALRFPEAALSGPMRSRIPALLVSGEFFPVWSHLYERVLSV